MRCVAYLRVSTRAQDHEPQRHAIARFAEARGLALDQEYVDTISGRRAERPGLRQLLDACRRGEVGAVVIARLDRLGRSVRDVCNIAHELEAHGVDLVVADGGLDTSSPQGKLLFHVLAAVSEMERSLIVARVNAGLAVARAKGKRLGRPRSLDADVIECARTLVAGGASLRAAARQLGVSYSALRRADHRV